MGYLKLIADRYRWKRKNSLFSFLNIDLFITKENMNFTRRIYFIHRLVY